MAVKSALRSSAQHGAIVAAPTPPTRRGWGGPRARIGTRYTDFTTASKTAFEDPAVRFVNINVAGFDAAKHHALPLLGDARASLDELLELLGDYRVDDGYCARARQLHDAWESEVERIYGVRLQPLPSQGELIGVVNELGDPESVVVCAAGSLPGDLHKLWRARHPKQYHLEYGYSTMGYEIAGGLGVKMADPAREVYVLVGDGSYLMMSSEIVTSIQEGYKLTIVLMDNAGFKSIGGLSRSLGQGGFGTRYVYPRHGVLPGDEEGPTPTALPVDLAANARSLGADVIACSTYDDVVAALVEARTKTRTTVILRAERSVGWRPELSKLVGRRLPKSARCGRCRGTRRVGAQSRSRRYFSATAPDLEQRAQSINARRVRLLTVPSGRPSSAAISLWVSPLK
jgi:3D-(3,5/4)-trihydroxycyclohexane-1,2-dione acylhydrolase (decyclizing)